MGFNQQNGIQPVNIDKQWIFGFAQKLWGTRTLDELRMFRKFIPMAEAILINLGKL